MEHVLDWRWMLARGILGVLFGIAILCFPGPGLVAIALLFAFYVVLDGLMALSAARQFHRQGAPWRFLAFEGSIGILAGIAAAVFPGAALLTLVVLMSVWALLTGVIELYAGFA